MDFWTEAEEPDEEFAEQLQKFILESYPELSSRVPPGAIRRNDREFMKRLAEWRHANMAAPTLGQRVAYRQQLEHFGIESSAMTSTNIVLGTIEKTGTDAQKTYFRQKYEEGAFRAALGFTEPDSGSDVGAARTRAVRDGDEWVINGQKIFTSGVDEASHVFLLTRTNTEVPKHKGLTMFLVPVPSPGLEIRTIETLGYQDTHMTFYVDARVPDTARLGNVDEGWRVLMLALSLEHGEGDNALRGSEGQKPRGDQSECRGPVLGRGKKQAGKILQKTIEWSKTENRSSGLRPIDDVIVRERLARLAVYDEVARLIARRNDPLQKAPGVGNAAKIWWTEMYVYAANECMDIVGSEAVLPFTDDLAVANGAVEVGFRASPISTVYGGANEVHLDIIAERRLQLPKGRSSGR